MTLDVEGGRLLLDASGGIDPQVAALHARLNAFRERAAHFPPADGTLGPTKSQSSRRARPDLLATPPPPPSSTRKVVGSPPIARREI